MMISSLAHGCKLAVKNKRMIAVLYLVNLAFGLIVMLPFRAAIMSFAGNSLAGGQLARRFDMDFLIELLTKNNPALSAIFVLMLVAGTLYWVLNLFLSGGVYAILVGSGIYSPTTFWGNSAKNFGKYFRLMLWSLPVFGILYSIQYLVPLVVRLVWGTDPYQNITWWSGWIRTGLGYFAILVYLIVFDYARIYVVTTDERSMFKSLGQGTAFALKNFFNTLGISASIFVLGIVLIVAYNPLADALMAPHAPVVVVLLTLQQLYIFIRMGFRLALYGSQARLYLAHRPLIKEAEFDSIKSVFIQPASE